MITESPHAIFRNRADRSGPGKTLANPYLNIGEFRIAFANGLEKGQPQGVFAACLHTPRKG
jgi:hypothetical protein